ncbi:carboxypeptidase-like regulatory domain-containing protein [Parabacteroides sp. AF48-14]|uniref:carboxypeptidase-like regulatory domain-containing protein n=1 Tax=Parabacteroides sp. AF48-14 TaxID=2292052 RepID=UPI001F3E7D37|nr:carboxypeptidase-like regulatory domain-containing protein [Parabacteroides sp. AF48-14]
MKESSLKTHSKQGGAISNLLKMLTLLLFAFCTTTVFAQQKTIKGTVIDATGEPLIGVNVSVKGTTTGIITDIDGKYTLDVPTNAIIVFSYIGYRTQEVSAGNQTSINITLQEDTQNIDEVVVVGYGVQKKETVTGSVSTLKGEDLIKSPVANLSNAIAGKMSGVVTYQRSGEPGYDGATIRIRGSNTLGNNDPLIVIDGVAARAGGLERLDPNEIETMSVLKDASAAIYGARAANGVILITTKKGRAAKKPDLPIHSIKDGLSRPTCRICATP